MVASPIRTLTVNFVGKTDSLDKAFKRVSKGSTLMSDRMRRAATIGMGAFVGIGAAVVGAVAVLKPMIEASADVEESLSKNRVLFGDAAQAAERFAETSAEAFGISRREALEAVGVFGALAHAMGMPHDEGVDLSVTMVKLAADMASFNNASPEETLVALQAGQRENWKHRKRKIRIRTNNKNNKTAHPASPPSGQDFQIFWGITWLSSLLSP